MTLYHSWNCTGRWRHSQFPISWLKDELNNLDNGHVINKEWKCSLAAAPVCWESWCSHIKPPVGVTLASNTRNKVMVVSSVLFSCSAMKEEDAAPCFGTKLLTWLFFFCLSGGDEGGGGGATRSQSRAGDISGAFRCRLSLRDLPAALAFPQAGGTLLN